MTATRGITAVDLAAIFDRESPKTPTEEQRAIIEAPLESAAVVAGAGSGKTETMATRVVWLVANGVVAPERILGLTFTRKAAAELAERVRRRLTAWRSAQDGPVPAGEPTVSTYAAYAGQLVGEHAVRLGEEPVARLLSAASDWQVARDVVAAWDGNAPDGFGTPATVVQRLMALAGRMADHLVDADAVRRVGADLADLVEALPPGERTRSPYPKATGEIRGVVERRAALLPLVERFTAAKRAGRARDFADEMMLAAALAALDVVRAAERERYGAVLLDEYQDTGFAQVTMLSRLFGGHPVMAVGDPLQSIYGWRGASTGTMAGFPATFRHPDGAEATVYRLQTSWRNDRTVLHVANRIARPLHDPTISVELAARPGVGAGTVHVARTASVVEEAEWVAASMTAAWDAMPVGGRTAAVLVRKRSQIPLLERALSARGLLVEVVDLGGLLTVPEVADVYATLQAVADHTAGAALTRLLAGARWRIGVRDLQALQQRARWLLADRRGPVAPVVAFGSAPAPAPAPGAGAGAGADDGKDPLGEATHLVEALDDLGPESAYSAEGFRRMTILQGELRRLRARAAAPLPELVADVEHTIGLDVEVAARSDVNGRSDRGRAHLDRFLAEVTRFADEVDHATLAGFLAFLAAAEEEENGLGAGEIEVDPERVQILTVHGAKGLEWDVVAVPGLVEKVFPGAKVDDDWVRAPAHLPDTLRGDAAHIPHLDLDAVASRNDLGDRTKRYHEELGDRRREEERRLAYVAVTRARSTLLASGYVWDHTTKPRAASEFLEEVRDTDGVEVDAWTDDTDVPVNPMAARVVEQWWPFDPMGARRPAVESGADLVRAALAERAAGRVPAPESDRALAWAHDAELLLAERDRAAEGTVVEVDLPSRLSVSALVTLHDDPDALARSLRRRMPTRPNPRARRGTAFHQWLEQRWLPRAQAALLDVDELPGAADESVTATGAAELAALRAAFEASGWAAREPHAVEVPFEMLVGGRVVRGRMDAVFTDGTDADGHERWLVVDWKTGPPPGRDHAAAAAVQLAAYRLAWADLAGVPVERVDAAFHHVLADVTIRPTSLLDADQLRELLDGAPAPDAD